MRYTTNFIESELGNFKTYTEEVEEPKRGIVAWTKDLETGNDVLDGQHRRYIDLLNEYLYEASESDNTVKNAGKLAHSFDFLRQYAEEHFSTEESLMKDTNFPDFEEHREEHLYFLKHVEDLHRAMENEGFSPRLAREVNFYAVEWFIDHILGSDMLLVEFLKLKH
jgi:hemerythrin